jgi:hypothetical protein
MEGFVFDALSVHSVATGCDGVTKPFQPLSTACCAEVRDSALIFAVFHVKLCLWVLEYHHGVLMYGTEWATNRASVATV